MTIAEKSAATKQSLSSGALAGFASVLLLQPLDVIKTRLQEQPASSFSARLGRVLDRTRKVDGIRGFWRGTLPTLIRNVPGVAIYFVTLNQIQYLSYVGWKREFPLINHFYDAKKQRMSNLGNLMSGAIARTIAGTILIPVTVLKVRFESSQYKYRSLTSAISSIFQGEGVRGLFKGVGVTALRDAPHAGIYLLFYESIKPILPSGGTGSKLIAGITAGFLATATTQPFDLLKTRIQLSKQPTGLVSTLTEVIRSEGVIGLFNGMGPRLLRKSLSSAITWTVYEELIQWYKSFNK